MKKIYFIHEGKANYPAIKANKVLLANSFLMEEACFSEAQSREDITQSICWHMMGFYPKKLPSALTIHDYRSLSVGKFRWAKDRLKRYFNAKPDIRIIQPSIVSELGFNDDVPSVLLDVGISDAILSYRNKEIQKLYDFCYVGAMNSERKIHLMVDSFLHHFGDTKNLAMVGKADKNLIHLYKKNMNVLFLGPVCQEKVFEIIAGTNVIVCYFPDHFPHTTQTPTKLLEAAALGARILANDQLMNRSKSIEYNIKAVWGSTHDIFANLPEIKNWENNIGIDPTPMLWSTMIKNCGLLDRLKTK